MMVNVTAFIGRPAVRKTLTVIFLLPAGLTAKDVNTGMPPVLVYPRKVEVKHCSLVGVVVNQYLDGGRLPKQA